MSPKNENSISNTLAVPSYSLLKHLEFIDYDMFALESIPDFMIERFIEYKNKREEYYLSTIQSRIDNYENPENDRVLQEKKNLMPVYIPNFLKEYICFDKEKLNYIYSKEIPSYLEVFVENFMRKVEERNLKNFELFFKNKIQIERLKSRIIRKFPDILYKYVRLKDSQIVHTNNIPTALLSMFEEYKTIYENELYFNKILETEGWFSLPPEILYGYIHYDNNGVVPAENMPEDLKEIFNLHKKSFDKRIKEYLNFGEKYPKVLPF